jgi:hypothetical protein
MQVTNFEPAHLAAIKLQSAQAHEGVGRDVAMYATQLGPAWSLVHGETVLAIGGFWPVKPCTALGWMYISGDIGPARFVRLMKTIQRHLKAAPWERIDFIVDNGFEQGHRMARLLKATTTSTVTVEGRDGVARVYAVYSRGSGHGWH